MRESQRERRGEIESTSFRSCSLSHWYVVSPAVIDNKKNYNNINNNNHNNNNKNNYNVTILKVLFIKNNLINKLKNKQTNE